MRMAAQDIGHRGWSGPVIVASLAMLAAYIMLAYLLLPPIWKQVEEDDGLAGRSLVTRTAQGIPGDPLNIALIAAPEALAEAMEAAGWSRADPLTWATGREIVDAVLTDRPYRTAPVSALFYEGRREDIAFEREAARSPERRHHVRLWRVADGGGTPLWLGAASYDAGLGLSHYTGAVTHRISPDIDAERDGLAADLEASGWAARILFVPGIGATARGANGEGDLYRTDGLIRLVVVARPAPIYRPVAMEAP